MEVQKRAKEQHEVLKIFFYQITFPYNRRLKEFSLCISSERELWGTYTIWETPTNRSILFWRAHLFLSAKIISTFEPWNRVKISVELTYRIHFERDFPTWTFNAANLSKMESQSLGKSVTVLASFQAWSQNYQVKNYGLHELPFAIQ